MYPLLPSNPTPPLLPASFSLEIVGTSTDCMQIAQSKILAPGTVDGDVGIWGSAASRSSRGRIGW